MAPKAQFKLDGVHQDLTPAAAKTGGDVVDDGLIAKVADDDIAASGTGSALTKLIVEVEKVQVACVEGRPAYFDNNGDPYGGTTGDGACTPTAAAADFCMGRFAAAAGSTAKKVKVELNAHAIVGTLNNIIDDPGAAGAIPVTRSGYCALVTTGADTRTLADASFPGQVITLSLMTDGGDCVITAASPVDQLGNTILTLGDAGDSVSLVAVQDGADIEWRILAAHGVNQVNRGAAANVITDPGDAGAIPVTRSGYCPLVTSGAEARSLADASFAGQILTLSLKTDGGDALITAASPINAAGNNECTMADVGDVLVLIAVEDGADVEWRVLSSDGCALSTAS